MKKTKPSDAKTSVKKAEIVAVTGKAHEPVLLPIHDTWHMDRLAHACHHPEKVFLEKWAGKNGANHSQAINAIVQNPGPRDFRVCAALCQWLGTNCGLSFLSDVFHADDEMKKIGGGFIGGAFLSFIKEKTNYIRSSFIQKMNFELMSNSKKGDWNAWKPDSVQLIAEMNHHMEKLRQALMAKDKVSEFSADMANFCMKADETHGA